MLDIGPGITAVLASLVTGGCALAGVMLMTRSNARQVQSQRTWKARKQTGTCTICRSCRWIISDSAGGGLHGSRNPLRQGRVPILEHPGQLPDLGAGFRSNHSELGPGEAPVEQAVMT